MIASSSSDSIEAWQRPTYFLQTTPSSPQRVKESSRHASGSAVGTTSNMKYPSQGCTSTVITQCGLNARNSKRIFVPLALGSNDTTFAIVLTLRGLPSPHRHTSGT